jgi:exodeoxyribonuclease X
MMKSLRILVTDTETTGDGSEDQVVEISVRGREISLDGEILKRWSWHSLVRPTIPIKHEARAVHHITDDELAGAPTMADLLEQCPELGGLRVNKSFEEDNRIFAGHAALFDRRMLAQSAPDGVDLMLPVLEIDTHRCALSIWPDAPRHSNQVLRYWLDLQIPKNNGTPHRAQHDTLVTEGILERLMEVRSAIELTRITREPITLKHCRIGEHAGKLWQDVPQGFLEWLLAKGPKRPNPRGGRDIGFTADERHTAQFWLDVKRSEFALRYEQAREKRLGKDGG